MRSTNSRNVIVTGGSTGIGFAVARRFAQAGDQVTITARSRNDLEHAVLNLKYEDLAAEYLVADISNRCDSRMVIDSVNKSAGPIDILINNAGVGIQSPLIEMDYQSWLTNLRTNLYGTMTMSRLFASQIIHEDISGVIINTSSINANYVEPTCVAYGASKAGIEAVTRGMALELARYRIRICSVQPGYIDTPMIDKAFPDSRESSKYRRDARRAIPIGRLGNAAEVAEVFYFLASPDASYITGTSIVVDGGVLTKHG